MRQGAASQQKRSPPPTDRAEDIRWLVGIRQSPRHSSKHDVNEQEVMPQIIMRAHLAYTAVAWVHAEAATPHSLVGVTHLLPL
ncbi:hypothetical protein ABBQ38_007949 [Trebouxia sp. C0009 RCD-2024]